MTYRERLATKGLQPIGAIERTMKRGGDIVITSRGAHVVPGRKGAFAGYKPELVG